LLRPWSDIEDEDVDTAEVPSNYANTFGRNLFRRLNIPHDHIRRQRLPAPHPLLIMQLYGCDGSITETIT